MEPLEVKLKEFRLFFRDGKTSLAIHLEAENVENLDSLSLAQLRELLRSPNMQVEIRSASPPSPEVIKPPYEGFPAPPEVHQEEEEPRPLYMKGYLSPYSVNYHIWPVGGGPSLCGAYSFAACLKMYSFSDTNPLDESFCPDCLKATTTPPEAS